MTTTDFQNSKCLPGPRQCKNRPQHVLRTRLCSGWRHWLPALFVVFCYSVAGAQSEVRITLDSNYAETGNPFIVHIVVPQSLGKPGQVIVSAWDSLIPEQNILQQTEWTPGNDGFTKDLTVVVFDADTLTLPALPVHINGQGVAMSNPLGIVILATPSPDDLVDMSAIKDIRREPAWWTDYLPWALGIGGLVLLILLTAWLIDRAKRKKNGAASSRTVGLPPHELAWKKLDVLGQKQLWAKGLYKEYCAELTFIVREYLEKRYAVPALESTTDETLEHLRKTELPERLRPELAELLTKADLIKFAKASPQENFHLDAMAFARKIISETKPLPIPENPDSPNSNPPVKIKQP